MRCLRRFNGSDMAGLVNDSQGEFFVIALNNAQELADATLHVFYGVCFHLEKCSTYLTRNVANIKAEIHRLRNLFNKMFKLKSTDLQLADYYHSKEISLFAKLTVQFKIFFHPNFNSGPW